MRRSRRGKNPRGLSLHLAIQPELRRGVDEGLHLCCHIPVACWAAEDHAIRCAKIVERAFWDRRLRVVYLLRITALFVQILYSIRKLPGPTQYHVGSSYTLCSFFHGLSHRQNVYIDCVVHHENFHLRFSLRRDSRAAKRQSQRKLLRELPFR